jgi:hypothetical protein
MKTKPKNEGQRRLIASGHPHTTIAKAAGVAKSTAQGWRGGALPPPDKRVLLEAFDPYLAQWTWTAAPHSSGPAAAGPPTVYTPPAALPAEVPPAPAWATDPAFVPPPMPPRGPEPPPPTPYEVSTVDLDEPGAARALVVAQIKRLQADCARLRAGRASDEAIRKAEDAEIKAARDLARLAGELNPTDEARLVKSVKWHAVKVATLKALEPWPEAVKAVAAAFAREESL